MNLFEALVAMESIETELDAIEALKRLPPEHLAVKVMALSRMVNALISASTGCEVHPDEAKVLAVQNIQALWRARAEQLQREADRQVVH